MEFHEKLQQLRKGQGLTQEELARRLYVSRTAVSKWENGRGYPNLDSLKAIAGLFSLSVDQLLSGDELVEVAETARHDALRRVSGVVFGLLDVMAAALLFLPILGRQNGAEVQVYSVLEYARQGSGLRVPYVAALVCLTLFGVLELLAEKFRRDGQREAQSLCSAGLHAAAVLLFALSRQPYMTAWLFLLFLVKLALFFWESRQRTSPKKGA